MPFILPSRRSAIQKDIPPQQGLKRLWQSALASRPLPIQKDIPPQQGLKLKIDGLSLKGKANDSEGHSTTTRIETEY